MLVFMGTIQYVNLFLYYTTCHKIKIRTFSPPSILFFARLQAFLGLRPIIRNRRALWFSVILCLK